MSIGMDRHTGRWLTDLNHLKQSIQVILMTRIGTRTERRLFGSLVPSIIDYPMDKKYTMMLYASIATALAKHEPRIKLERLIANVSNKKDNPTLEIELVGVLKVDADYSEQVRLLVEL